MRYSKEHKQETHERIVKKASVRLHEKAGFRHVGRYEAVGYKFDRWLDIVHLQKAL